MKQFRSVLFFAALTSVLPRVSQAEDPQGAFIKGTTDFLLDRANDNYIYIFQRKLESNPLVKKYLPATLRVARAGDLRALLTHKELWKDALKEDFEKDRLLAAAVENLKHIREQLCTGPDEEPKTKNLCATAQGAISGVENKSVESRDAPVAPRSRVGFTTYGKKEVLEDLVRDVGAARPAACRDLKPGKYTACAIEIIALLDAAAHADYLINCYLFGNWCSNGERKLAFREEDDDFSDFRRFALFFAQMADAADTNDPDKVKALLKSVTVPPVSFGIKREPHRTRVLVTSYLGGAWSTAIHRNDQTLVFAAPIGVEISQARDSGNSLSLMLSPLDFGYPLSLKLNDADTKIRASDVVVPSAYLFYGLKDYPLAIGAGYARVRSIDNPGRREGRFLVLIAFDMPLFKLH